jgi:hypothetical protein
MPHIWVGYQPCVLAAEDVLHTFRNGLKGIAQPPPLALKTGIWWIRTTAMAEQQQQQQHPAGATATATAVPVACLEFPRWLCLRKEHAAATREFACCKQGERSTPQHHTRDESQELGTSERVCCNRPITGKAWGVQLKLDLPSCSCGSGLLQQANPQSSSSTLFPLLAAIQLPQAQPSQVTTTGKNGRCAELGLLLHRLVGNWRCYDAPHNHLPNFQVLTTCLPAYQQQLCGA